MDRFTSWLSLIELPVIKYWLGLEFSVISFANNDLPLPKITYFPSAFCENKFI